MTYVFAGQYGSEMLIDPVSGAPLRSASVTVKNPDGTAAVVDLTSSAPFTWAASDQLFLNGSYPAA